MIFASAAPDPPPATHVSEAALRRRDGTSIYERGPRFDRQTDPQAAADEESRYKKIDRKILSRLLKLLWPYRQAYLLSIVVVLFGGTIEQLDKTFIGKVIDQALNLTNVVAVQDGRTSIWQPMGIALFWCGLWALVFAIGITLHRFLIAHQARTGEAIIVQLRETVFRQLQRLSMSFYDKTKLGRIITRGSSDIDSLRDVLINGLTFVATQTCFMTVAAIMILWEDWRLFLSICWLAPLITLINHFYRRRLGEAWQVVRAGYTRVTTNLAENITGMRVVAAFDRQEANLDRFNELQDYNSANNLRAAQIQGTYLPLLSLIRFIGQLVILVYGGYQVSRSNMKVGAVVAVMLYWDAYMGPALNFGNFYNQLMVAMASAERVFNLLDLEPTVKDQADAKPLPQLIGHVRFDHVTFGYNPERPILHDLDFDVQPGQTLALVGHTGSGKTSIVSLLARFYQPQKGHILLDGTDVATVTAESLSRQVGLVLQQNFLFPGSVLDNIRYGRPEATDAEVRQAAKSLDCLDLIEGLERGFDTSVGERGGSLSLGQRQLICFCRAFLANPRLLMLDEATSAVDTATELKLQKAVERLTAGRTTIIVAHRLSTIVNADQILVLEHGRIIERGDHAELLELEGHYAELYRQFAMGFGDES